MLRAWVEEMRSAPEQLEVPIIYLVPKLLKNSEPPEPCCPGGSHLPAGACYEAQKRNRPPAPEAVMPGPSAPAFYLQRQYNTRGQVALVSVLLSQNHASEKLLYTTADTLLTDVSG
jgi:hypothetical protein